MNRKSRRASGEQQDGVRTRIIMESFSRTVAMLGAVQGNAPNGAVRAAAKVAHDALQSFFDVANEHMQKETNEKAKQESIKSEAREV